eukprot:6178629-Pleurochrysis_carterae.AAC.1
MGSVHSSMYASLGSCRARPNCGMFKLTRARSVSGPARAYAARALFNACTHAHASTHTSKHMLARNCERACACICFVCVRERENVRERVSVSVCPRRTTRERACA